MFDAFLKIEGIDGESTDEKHKNWIEVLSFSWGVTQPSSASPSTAGSLTAERASFSDFAITKALDKATPKLVENCISGQHIKKIQFDICRAGGDKQSYMLYTMTDVIVTGVRPGGSGRGETLPLEEVSFNYAKFEMEYNKLDMTGKPAGKVTAGWDLVKNAKV